MTGIIQDQTAKEEAEKLEKQGLKTQEEKIQSTANCSGSDLSDSTPQPSAGEESGAFAAVGSYDIEEENKKTSEQLQVIKDCAQMTLTQLNKKYSAEYNSFRNRRSKAKEHFHYKNLRELLLDIGPKPQPNWQLDRIDNTCPVYAPGHCRWLPRGANMENRGVARWLTDHTGETLPAMEWARRKESSTGVSAETMIKRVDASGYCEDCAIHAKHYQKCEHKAVGSPVILSDVVDEPLPPTQKTPAQFGESVKVSQEAQAVLSIFREVLRKKYDKPAFVTEAKHSLLGREIAEGIRSADLIPTEVVTAVVYHWEEFIEYSEDMGQFNLPKAPTLTRLRGDLTNACNFWHTKAKQFAVERRKQMIVRQQEETRQAMEAAIEENIFRPQKDRFRNGVWTVEEERYILDPLIEQIKGQYTTTAQLEDKQWWECVDMATVEEWLIPYLKVCIEYEQTQQEGE